MFINYAYAQSTETAASGGFAGILSTVLPFILVLFIVYILLIRPQKKLELERQKQLNSLKKGDKVLTNAGIYGVVSKIGQDDDVVVEIAENVKVTMRKSAIALINPPMKSSIRE